MDEYRTKFQCIKCHNIPYLEPDKVKYHLCKLGFVPNSQFQDKHGEPYFDNNKIFGTDDTYKTLNKYHESTYRDMVIDEMDSYFISSIRDKVPNA